MPPSDVMLSLDAISRAQSVTNAFGDRAPPGPAQGASARAPLAAIGEGREGERNGVRQGEGRGEGIEIGGKCDGIGL